MKFCAIICEYNPFHNGHEYQIRKAKEITGADHVICLMSGNFTERGECAIMDKYTRAKHAVLGGADIVIELPTVFATSPAEIFAKGAISLLKHLPDTVLVFGVENGTKDDFLSTSKKLIQENEFIKETIQNKLSEGLSPAKARAIAYEQITSNIDLTTPNNILGIEYTKAILEQNANIDICPIQRIDNGYNSQNIDKFSSASAIRNNYLLQDVSVALPDYVYNDLMQSKDVNSQLLFAERLAVLSSDLEEMKKICDCTEGLENAIKKQVFNENIVEEITSKRYISSRIRRILLHNLLKIEKQFIFECLENNLYFNVLAIQETKSNEILSKLTALPILLRAHDENKLNALQLKCLSVTKYADEIYMLLTNTQPNTINKIIKK